MNHKLLALTIFTIVALSVIACSGTPTESDTGSTSADTFVKKDLESKSEVTLSVGTNVGQRIPEFIINLTEDRSKTSTEILAEGKPVFIYFMATWCPTCRGELKKLKTAYSDYKAKVEFYVVSIDPTETIQELEAYRIQEGQEWVMATAGQGMLAILGIRSQSSKIAFGADGVIVYRDGFADGDISKWTEVLQEISGG
jgi:thiol-disulfide isomerase/thioredoxin